MSPCRATQSCDAGAESAEHGIGASIEGARLIYPCPSRGDSSPVVVLEVSYFTNVTTKRFPLMRPIPRLLSAALLALVATAT